MSNTLVTYVSLSGNTQLIAQAIYETLAGRKEIKPVDEVAEEELAAYDLIFIGFPVHSHSVPFKMEKFLKKLPKGKSIALFSTHGSLSGSRLSREALEYAVTLTSQARLLGTFVSRGKVSPEAMELLGRSPEHELWVDMAASARRHPDEHDLEDARTFARHIQRSHRQG